MMEIILAIDVGSSSVKCLLMTLSCDILKCVSAPYPTFSPQYGHVEQNPDDWLDATLRAVRGCLEEYSSTDIHVEAICVTGQMSGPVLLDGAGSVLHRVITISDARSTRECDEIGRKLGPEIKRRMGNVVINAFTAPKLLWVRNNLPDVFQRVSTFLLPKDYIRYRLTGALCSDPTDAGNTFLFNPFTAKWDDDVLRELGISKKIVPEVVPPHSISGYLRGEIAKELGLPQGIPIVTGAADMACNAIGTGIVEPQAMAITLGTSAQVLKYVTEVEHDHIGQVTLHPHVISGAYYSLGSHFSGGLSANWLSRMIGNTEALNFDHLQRLAQEAERVPEGSNGVLFIPYLVGSGTPDFCSDDTASFLGLRVNTTRAAMFRAVLEGVCYDIRRSVDLLGSFDGPSPVPVLAGGGSKIPIWRNIMADVIGLPLKIMQHEDSSTVGCALLGAHAIGAVPDLVRKAEELASRGVMLEPVPEHVEIYQQGYGLFKQALSIQKTLYNHSRTAHTETSSFTHPT